MVSRRLMFGLSVLCVVLIYTILFMVAPNIQMIQTHMKAQRLAAHFNVKLRDPGQILGDKGAGNELAFAARPGSVSDLLKPDASIVVPAGQDTRGAEVPRLAARIGQDRVEPEALNISDSLSRMDAQVLAISRDTARSALDVPRRLVRTGEEPAAPADILPTLREPGPQTVVMLHSCHLPDCRVSSQRARGYWAGPAPACWRGNCMAEPPPKRCWSPQRACPICRV